MSNRTLAEEIYPIATVNRTRAELVKSSVHVTAADARRDPTRFDSIYAVFPKMVLGERNRHRGFSLSDRSSRAVPPEKLISEIRSGVGLAMPAKFRKRVTGMGGGDDLIGDELYDAKIRWIEYALDCADSAEASLKYEAKETTNRRLDMVIYMHTLQSGVRDIWWNFFGLRLDAGADPTIVVLTQKTFEVYKKTEPERLAPGMWHLPFVDREEQNELTLDAAIDFSAARSAHLSYNDLETGQRMVYDRAQRIVKTLRDSRPLHPSPFEHQATPDTWVKREGVMGFWANPYLHGNLPGWCQQRKMIEGEAVAPLPLGYEL